MYCLSQGQGFPYSPGHIFGLTLSNNTLDTNNDIDIGVGSTRDDSDAANIVLGSTLTKRLDAVFVEGTNQGGLDTGAKAISRTYNVYAIRRPDTGVVDALFSLSATAPTMPANYTQKRRIGAVLTDAAGNIRQFIQEGNYFYWKTPPLDVNNAAPGTLANTVALSAPLGIKTLVRVQAFTLDNSQFVYVSALNATDMAPSVTVAPLASTGSGAIYAFAPVDVWTNTLAQIRYRAAANQTIRIVTLFWLDPRGQF